MITTAQQTARDIIMYLPCTKQTTRQKALRLICRGPVLPQVPLTAQAVQRALN